MRPENELDATYINSIRTRSAAAGTAANARHPGAPMRMTIFERVLQMVPNGSRIGLGSGRAAQTFVKGSANVFEVAA